MEICSVLPHLQNCGDETSDQPWVEAREPPWSEAQDKHGCRLYANASPAFSTQSAPHPRLGFILTQSTPLLMHSLHMWYQGYETVILFYRLTLKSITSQAFSAFKEHSDLVNQSCSSLRLFHSFSVECGFLRDVPTLSTSRVPHSLGTSVRTSHPCTTVLPLTRHP